MIYFDDLLDTLNTICWNGTRYIQPTQSMWDRYFDLLSKIKCTTLVTWLTPFSLICDKNNYDTSYWERYVKDTAKLNPSTKIEYLIKFLCELRQNDQFGHMLVQAGKKYGIELIMEVRPFECSLSKYYQYGSFLPLASPFFQNNWKNTGWTDGKNRSFELINWENDAAVTNLTKEVQTVINMGFNGVFLNSRTHSDQAFLNTYAPDSLFYFTHQKPLPNLEYWHSHLSDDKVFRLERAKATGRGIDKLIKSLPVKYIIKPQSVETLKTMERYLKDTTFGTAYLSQVVSSLNYWTPISEGFQFVTQKKGETVSLGVRSLADKTIFNKWIDLSKADSQSSKMLYEVSELGSFPSALDKLKDRINIMRQKGLEVVFYSTNPYVWKGIQL